MNNNLPKIRALCSNYDFNGNTSDEYLFTLNCVDYFYYNKNIGEVDVLDGFTDGPGDGGIDFIYSNSEKIYLIQGKSSANISYDEIRDLLLKMNETIINLNNKNNDYYINKLVQLYNDKIETLDTIEYELVLFTNTIIDDALRLRIDKLSKTDELKDYTVTIYGKEEIDNQVMNIDNGDILVDTGKLLLDSPKNYLTYMDGMGAIFSIRASSLKELYAKYSNNGLFGYNLREHIVQKSVDSGIEKTIKQEKDNFWFFNNGITIGCSDYIIDGNKLVLYNFSIINGAQTTTNIGKSNVINSDNDFPLVCKVVKSANSLEDEFIRRISEASNSQKPIKFRDLKSNASEQKLLQSKSLNATNKLAIEIKRGVRPRNYKYVESWQRVTNEYIGQLLWACQYQCPGSARSKTSDIFGNETTYNMIFSKDKISKYDCETLFSFVKLGKLYDEFKIKYTENNFNKANLTPNETEKNDLSNKSSVCRNAKFTCLALISYFYKRIYLRIDNPYDKRLDEPNIVGDFSQNYDDEEKYIDSLNYLFEFIIDKISTIYDKYQPQLRATSHSNFLKTDKVYKDIIRVEFSKLFNDKYDREKIIDNMRIFG